MHNLNPRQALKVLDTKSAVQLESQIPPFHP